MTLRLRMERVEMKKKKSGSGGWMGGTFRDQGGGGSDLGKGRV